MNIEVNSIIEKIYENELGGITASSNDYINSLRDEAIALFRTYTLPTTKDEDYLYSDIESWFSSKLNDNISVNKCDLHIRQYTNGVVVCDINTFAKEYEHIFRKYYTKSVEDNSLMMLTRAFASGGSVVYVPSNVMCDEVVYLDFNTPAGSATLGHRNLYIFEKGALAKLHITHNNNGLTNSVTELFLEQGANVELSEEYLGDSDGVYCGTISANLQKDSFYKHIFINKSGGKCRVNESISLLGSGGEASVYGAVMARNSAHIDNYTLIKHQVERCKSFELIKNVASESATVSFNGNIFVAAGANVTEAYQQNNNILLTDEANIYSKPNLEIYADDVKCSHGATVGQLNEDAIFYMKQRGVPREMAQELLLNGFVMDIVNRISNAEVVERLKNSIDNV